MSIEATVTAIETRQETRGRPAVLSNVSPQTRLACRVFDVVVALAAIVFLSPLLVAVAVAVWWSDKGAAIFEHERIGQGGRPFKCLKFRSMVVDAEAKLASYLAANESARAEWELGHKLRSDPRVTPLGAFLRRSSLDELPQFFNVLRGDMSVVGPRPIVAGEVVHYGSRYADYCRVKPGITGLWQVSGRSDTTYRRRVTMDVVYARRKSFWWDVKLLALTLPAVLLSRGAY